MLGRSKWHRRGPLVAALVETPAIIDWHGSRGQNDPQAQQPLALHGPTHPSPLSSRRKPRVCERVSACAPQGPPLPRIDAHRLPDRATPLSGAGAGAAGAQQGRPGRCQKYWLCAGCYESTQRAAANPVHLDHCRIGTWCAFRTLQAHAVQRRQAHNRRDAAQLGAFRWCAARFMQGKI